MLNVLHMANGGVVPSLSAPSLNDPIAQMYMPPTAMTMPDIANMYMPAQPLSMEEIVAGYAPSGGFSQQPTSVMPQLVTSPGMSIMPTLNTQQQEQPIPQQPEPVITPNTFAQDFWQNQQAVYAAEQQRLANQQRIADAEKARIEAQNQANAAAAEAARQAELDRIAKEEADRLAAEQARIAAEKEAAGIASLNQKEELMYDFGDGPEPAVYMDMGGDNGWAYIPKRTFDDPGALGGQGG